LDGRSERREKFNCSSMVASFSMTPAIRDKGGKFDAHAPAVLGEGLEAARTFVISTAAEAMAGVDLSLWFMSLFLSDDSSRHSLFRSSCRNCCPA
jgi:hypothetical protein